MMIASPIHLKIRIPIKFLRSIKNIKFRIELLITKQISQMEAMKSKLIILMINLRTKNIKQINKTDCNQQKFKTIKS
jgi:hypothetical protein